MGHRSHRNHPLDLAFMNYNELVDLVKKTLLKNEPLKTADLQSPTIDAVSNDVLPNNLIRLDISKEKTPYEEDPKNKRIVVRGSGIDSPFSGLACELQFYFVDGETALTWSARGNDGWTLSRSFPWLESTICDDIRFATTSEPQILLNTHSQSPTTQQGMIFAGTIDIDAMSGGLAGVLGIQNLYISGPVILKIMAPSCKGSILWLWTSPTSTLA